MHHLVPPGLILTTHGLQEGAGTEKGVVVLLTNLQSGDFPLIEESLVFSCVGIIRWWRDIMRRWIPDPVSSGYYSRHPCPWLLSLVLNYPLKLSLFFFVSLLPGPTGCHLCFTHHFITSTATQHFSPIYVFHIRAEDNVWQTCVVWSCINLIWILQRLTSRMACLCTHDGWGERLSSFSGPPNTALEQAWKMFSKYSRAMVVGVKKKRKKGLEMSKLHGRDSIDIDWTYFFYI